MKSVLNNTEQMAFFVRRPIDLHKTLEMLPESRCKRNCVCVCVCVCVCPHLRLRAFVSLAMCVTGTEQVDKGGCKANSGAVLLPLLSCSPFHSSHAHTHVRARTHPHTSWSVGPQPHRFLPSSGDHFSGSSGLGRASEVVAEAAAKAA